VNPKQAETEIHRLALNADNVFLLPHAKTRNPLAGKRPLSKPEIVNVLRNGHITEGPSPDIKLKSGWKFKMVRMIDGGSFEVAGVFIPQGSIVVITGYEDQAARSIRRPRRPGGIGGDGQDTE
jgi:hypothetical protein